MSEWKPGDVAMVTGPAPFVDQGNDYSATSTEVACSFTGDGLWKPLDRGSYGFQAHEARTARPLVVIDPEDVRQIERLGDLLSWALHTEDNLRLQHALREFADPKPPKPEEPTDPKAIVIDRRDNVWRLLADGEWVCTSGPDIGEYLGWDRLASERGPVEVAS